jgi:tetratricopeptide (TPR) repeat protein
VDFGNLQVALKRATAAGRTAQVQTLLDGMSPMFDAVGQGIEDQVDVLTYVDTLRARGLGNLSREELYHVAGIQHWRASIYRGVESKPERRARMDDSLSIWRRIDDAYGLAYCYNMIVESQLCRDWAEAEQMLEESWALGTRIDNDYIVLWTLRLRGEMALQQGTSEQVRETLGRYLEQCRRLDWRFHTAWGYADLGHVAFACGQYGQAREHHLEGLAILEAMESQEFAARFHGYLGDVAAALASGTKALQEHRRALATFRRLGLYWWVDPPVLGGA